MLEGRKMAKSYSFEKNAVKKGAWSKEEDEKLRAYIQRYGHWNWALLPKFAGLSRSGKSCRLRWMNYLRPNMKHGNFTKEEDDIIFELHKKLGNKWSAIAANMPGRSDNEIKNRWNTHLKKRAQDDDITLDSEHLEFMEPNLGNPEGNPEQELQNERATSSEPTPTELPLCSTANDEFWTEPFLQDIESSFDTVLSPLNVVDYLMSQTSCEDMMMMMNDDFSWSI